MFTKVINEKDFLRYVENLTDGITTTDLANLYGRSAKIFNQLLQDLGVHYKRTYNGKEKWILKKNFSNKNLMVVNYSNYINHEGQILTFKGQPKWTKKGILYIYYFLKKHKIEPIKLNEDEIEKKIEQLSFIN